MIHTSTSKATTEITIGANHSATGSAGSTERWKPTTTLRCWMVIALVAAGSCAQACSPLANTIFRVDSAKRQRPMDTRSGLALHPPAPIIHSVSVKRGRGANGGSCADIGFAEIMLDLPADSAFSFADLGYYFRVVKGANILSGDTYPVTPRSQEGNRATFVFFWRDGAPVEQEPLDLVIEVFAITHYLELSPTSTVVVQADVRR